jgi:hypothetical protein
MSDTPIRVGIIGCGMITQRSHAPGFAKVPGVTIAALCNLAPERTVKVRDEHAPLAGARGGIGMTYNLLPGLFVKIYEAAHAGDLALALARQQEIVAWLDIAFRANLFSVFEAVLRDQGMPLRCFRTERPPLAPETEQAVLEVTRRLAGEHSG